MSESKIHGLQHKTDTRLSDAETEIDDLKHLLWRARKHMKNSLIYPAIKTSIRGALYTDIDAAIDSAREGASVEVTLKRSHDGE